LRVLLDARTVGRRFSGVGNYVLELVRAFSALDVDAEFLLCVHGASALRDRPLDPRFRFLETRISHESHPIGDVWENWILPSRAARHRVDVIHGPAFLVPTRGSVATVVTIHDLVAFTHPETIPARYALYMRWLLRRVTRAASRVVTDSESVRADLTRILRVDHGCVDVVPLGVADRFRRPDDAAIDAVVSRLEVPRPYLLFVGNLEPRKNLPGLIRAFRRVRRTHGADLRLVVAGQIAWKGDAFRDALATGNPDNDIRVLGYVSPDDLPALYAGAAAFVFPSFWEGFGLPVLEAMACGAPVVASNAASLPEVAGDAAQFVDPHSEESIAGGILAVLQDPARRSALVARGFDRARSLSWRRTAEATLAVYERVRERRP
jgi:glycosyltransferase involved in cell wall biosynthesis